MSDCVLNDIVMAKFRQWLIGFRVSYEELLYMHILTPVGVVR